MADDGSLRASDEDREHLVAVLREQMVAGRLTSEEFDERVGAAYAAKTWGDLRALVKDLPVTTVFADERVPPPRLAPRPPVRVPARTRRPSPLLPIAIAFLVLLIISDRLIFLAPILVFATIVVIIVGCTMRRGRRP
jgi:Domain of unknown function (DUF1707)